MRGNVVGGGTLWCTFWYEGIFGKHEHTVNPGLREPTHQNWGKTGIETKRKQKICLELRQPEKSKKGRKETNDPLH